MLAYYGMSKADGWWLQQAESINILQRLLGSSMVNFGNGQIHYRLLLRASQPRRRWCYHCTGSGNDDGYLSPFLCFLFLPQGRMSHPCHLGFEICGPVTLFSSGKHDYRLGGFGPVPWIFGYAALCLLVARVTYQAGEAGLACL